MATTNRALARRSPPLRIRPVTFEDVSETLRLVARAIAAGCRGVYGPAQLAAVYAGYASTLFVESLGPFVAIAARVQVDDADEDLATGPIVGYAQLDPSSGRLRALFVDGDFQGLGIGRALLREIETRARERGCARVHGAMSLNAVPFYEGAGYQTLAGAERLSSTGVPVPIVRMEKRLR